MAGFSLTSYGRILIKKAKDSTRSKEKACWRIRLRGASQKSGWGAGICTIIHHCNVTWFQSEWLLWCQHLSSGLTPLSDLVVSVELAGGSLGTDPLVIPCPASGSWPYQHWSISPKTDWHVGLKTASFAILHVTWQITWYLQSTRKFFLTAKGLQIIFLPRNGYTDGITS